MLSAFSMFPSVHTSALMRVPVRGATWRSPCSAWPDFPAVFGPVHGTSRQADYALIVLKLPICAALKRAFPALMTDEGRGYVVGELSP